MLRLLNYVNQYSPLTDADKAILVPYIKTHKIAKGTMLLDIGQTDRKFSVITKGLTRVYYIAPDSTEVSVWFGFEDNIGTEICSFISQTPSNYYVEAIKPLEYEYISYTDFNNLTDTLPAWGVFVRKVWEKTILNLIERRLGSFQFQTATERYQALLDDPDYLKLIPQKYLASYLGITPSSLSRLRKKK